MAINNSYDDENRVGLWEKKTKDGRVYFSGQWAGHWVDLFPNSYKQEGDKKPSFHLKLKPKDAPKDRYAGQDETGPIAQGPLPASHGPIPPQSAPNEPFFDDDISF